MNDYCTVVIHRTFTLTAPKFRSSVGSSVFLNPGLAVAGHRIVDTVYCSVWSGVSWFKAAGLDISDVSAQITRFAGL